MTSQKVYVDYWQRKDKLARSVPHFPVLKWWNIEELSESDKVLFKAIEEKSNLLDIGAGNFRVKKKIINAGFKGTYDTQDIGEEFSYTYNNINEISKKYGAIICLDVIEHLQLAEGLNLIEQLIERLEDGGVLVIQTPNARCIRHPLSWDMSHLHCYNLNDLWSYLSNFNLEVKGYRVVFVAEQTSLKNKFLSMIGSYVITRLLGMDYADNIMLIAIKTCSEL